MEVAISKGLTALDIGCLNNYIDNYFAQSMLFIFRYFNIAIASKYMYNVNEIPLDA